jgi:cytochrome c oxidase cbb3-type subunit IV
MDINDLRSLFTVLVFAFFIGIVWWAYSGQRKASFEEAANLPLSGDDDLIPAPDKEGAGRRDN